MDIDIIIENLIAEKRYDEVSHALNEYSIHFWKNIYPKKSYEERVSYWSGSFGRQMRWNGESGVDEFAVFSHSAYCFWKSHEPKIDEMLPTILKILGLNKERIYKLIEKK